MKQSLIHAAIFTPLADGGWGLPILIEDEPGTAKTAFIRAYAAHCDLPFESLSPSERGEGAFGVVPVPVKGVLTYPAPDWSTRMREGGIVFVDELTTAPPGLQAPLLGLVAGKRIGSHQLGPRVRVIGACNPPNLAAGGYDLSAPLANRFGWVRWGAPSVEEHTAYMIGRASGATDAVISALQEEARVLDAWGEAYAKAVGLETGFLSSQPDWKNKCPKVGDPSAARAWPSDRTWEYATRALASAYVHKMTDPDTDEYVSAFIGPKAHEAFVTFIEEADLPPAADLLDGKIPFVHDVKRLDRSAAMLNGAVALVTPEKAAKREARAAKLWECLAKLKGQSMDVAAPVAKALIGAGLHTSKEALPVLTALNPILTKAGVSGGVL